MKAYSIDYTLKGETKTRTISIDAKDLKSAKEKIGKKHGFKTGRNVTINKYTVIGFF